MKTFPIQRDAKNKRLENENEKLLLVDMEFENLKTSSTYDRYGQQIGHDDAGDYAIINKAFTIEVESLDNVFKLSQNHDVETRQSIIRHLEQNGSDDEKKIAKEMQQRIDIPKQNK